MKATDSRPECWRVLSAMATSVTLRVVEPGPHANAALDRAAAVFADVERSCTRFDPASPLMRANSGGSDWHTVPRECFLAVAEAAAAHRATGGLFEPRVLRTLESMGYDRSLPFRDGPVETDAGPAPALPVGRWEPGLDHETGAVRIGRHPVDLGGIAKGLAVRWAATELAGAGTAVLVEAGGDCFLGGPGVDGTGWRVAVEDPSGGPEPCAVLRLAGAGCATSSVQLRRWRAGGRDVHHLIDPRTGAPGGGSLRSVTVVDPDPARAEVWSKALLISGPGLIAGLACDRAIPALWVDDRGGVAASPSMTPYVLWRRDHG